MSQNIKHKDENFGQFNKPEDENYHSDTSTTSTITKAKPILFYRENWTKGKHKLPPKKTNKSELTDSVNTDTLYEKDMLTPPIKNSTLQPINASKSSLRTNEFKPSGILKLNRAIPPASAQIYHGINKDIHLNKQQTETKDYHIRMNINLKKY